MSAKVFAALLVLAAVAAHRFQHQRAMGPPDMMGIGPMDMRREPMDDGMGMRAESARMPPMMGSFRSNGPFRTDCKPGDECWGRFRAECKPGDECWGRFRADAKPGADKPGADKPGSDKPGADKPGSDKPGADKPVSDKPGSDKPGSDKPGSDKPAEEPSKPSPEKGGSGKCEQGKKCKKNSECGEKGTCAGADTPTSIVSKCNCFACSSFLKCNDGSGTPLHNCGGLVGACNTTTQKCDCAAGYKVAGFVDEDDAKAKFCGKTQCDGADPVKQCHGLPCLESFCSCPFG